MPEEFDHPDLEAADAPLAVIVETQRAETAIESLRAEGVYDDSRRVRTDRGEAGREDADDPARIALPITEPPTETRVLEVVRQFDPEFRTTDLEDVLAERGWSEAEIEMAPSSWAVIGSVILVTMPTEYPDETAVAEALLEIHGEADSVLADEGITNTGEAGTYREPRTRLLAGESDTETIHTEHGTRYGLDPATVMFSPGNQAERARMGSITDGDEHVFDMFAGIGYFTLPMARAGARVSATEINPTAFRYLLENAVLNKVDDRLEAYMADCRDLAGEVDADRVVMGYYGSSMAAGDNDGGDSHSNGGDDSDRGDDEQTANSPSRADEAHEFLPAALEALVPGGVVHYHEATPESRLWDRPLERLERAGEAAGRDFEILEKRRVKSHSAGVTHIVIDVRFE
ncbi:class I SAM-dependent methyltransferase family protein [Natronolimnobius sp. AArcel1]|uniref:class I SAM-dependent methyltransferase n=1 Tax=Natronolimnobius sp. AArcel1 TaxID=1679093 RepID=UPI0013ED96C0|nr:class I SAM-dependent methyltransferase family protein [Natronolimnobius sp. AArcel1]NGM68620.1 class I SAM-dependent methyltransferase family protein [Natronolimnobius sp. AArcel1]